MGLDPMRTCAAVRWSVAFLHGLLRLELGIAIHIDETPHELMWPDVVKHIVGGRPVALQHLGYLLDHLVNGLLKTLIIMIMRLI